MEADICVCSGGSTENNELHFEEQNFITLRLLAPRWFIEICLLFHDGKFR